MRVKVGNFLILVGLLVTWHLVFLASELYASRRMSERSRELADVLKATAVANLLLAATTVVFRIRMATPRFLLACWLLSSVLMIVSRLILRWLLAWTRVHGRNLRHILIVGTNRRSLNFVENIEARPELGYRIVGFADRDWDGSEEFRNSGQKIVCTLDDLPGFFRKSVVDEVLIALPMRSFHDDATRIAALCEEQGIMFRVLPDLFDLKSARYWTEEVEGQPLVTHHNGIPDGWQMITKRMLDFAIACIALVLLSPVLAGTALLIALTSRGPIFFRQKRVGLYKREFLVYKFRTMVVDAEKKMREVEHLNEVSGPVFKIVKDPGSLPLAATSGRPALTSYLSSLTF